MTRARRPADVADLIEFGGWALGGSVPFWVAGASAERLPGPFARLPLVAVGAFVPAGAAVIVAARRRALGALPGTLRLRGVHPAWWASALIAGTLPVVADGLRHGPWPATPPATIAAVGALYVAGALGEELGWTGFALPRLLRLTGSVPLSAALLGGYWMVWHLVPFVETGHAASWVALQSVQALLMRCMIVGLCAASGGRVWLAAALHAASNLAWTLSPAGGALYDPGFGVVVQLPIAVACLLAGRGALR